MSGFSEFGIGSDNTNPLPVSLLAFSGYRDGNKNILKWITASEQHAKGFEVQRSYNGAGFTTIGMVHTQAPGGNSSSPLNYQFTDISFSGEKQYYRLKQTDIDGRFTLSNVLLLKGQLPDKLLISSLAPNPVSSTLHVTLETPNHNTITLIITDASGKIIKQHAGVVETGTNSFDIDVRNLASGMYLLKAVCKEGCETIIHRFVKQ